MVHFGTREGGRDHPNFKPLVFGTFCETCSNNMVALVETAVEYGVEHLGRNMAASTVDIMRTAMQRRYKNHLLMSACRGYANLLLDKTKYVGTSHTTPNRAQIRQSMRGRGTGGSMPVSI